MSEGAAATTEAAPYGLDPDLALKLAALAGQSDLQIEMAINDPSRFGIGEHQPLVDLGFAKNTCTTAINLRLRSSEKHRAVIKLCSVYALLRKEQFSAQPHLIH